MFSLSVGPGELVLRAAIIYAFLYLALRWGGKKHVGEMAPFDLIVLLILSETVQNAMVGEDKSLLGGLICASTLLVLAQTMNWLSFRSKRLSRLLEGTPKILVRHGTRNARVMESEFVTSSELAEALRRNGCSNIADVRVAMLENDGKITVIKRQGT
jgi:uncharacterized membrane protein YcaP (DUF421 family)